MQTELWTLKAPIAVEIERADGTVFHVATRVLRVAQKFPPTVVPDDGMYSVKVNAVGQQEKDGQIILWDIFTKHPGLGISMVVRADHLISRVPVIS